MEIKASFSLAMIQMKIKKTKISRRKSALTTIRIAF